MVQASDHAESRGAEGAFAGIPGGRNTAVLVEALYNVVRRAHRLRAVRIHSHCDKAGLVLLSHLSEQGPMRMSDLAVAVQLDVSTVSRQVRALCDGGFVAALEDPSDKRARVLELSESGRAELQAVTAELGMVIGDALQQWNKADVDVLTRLLIRLADDLATERVANPTPQPGHTTSDVSANHATEGNHR